MSIRHLVNIIGLLLIFVSIAMAATGLGASFYEDGAAPALFISAAITLLVGLLTYSATKAALRPLRLPARGGLPGPARLLAKK